MSGEPEVLDEVTPELVRRVETALAEDTSRGGEGAAGGA